MLDHDFDRPFMEPAAMESYSARDKQTAQRYGKSVKALAVTNREYQQRFHKLAGKYSMKPPPGSAIHIMMGYLVVRKLGTPQQYETWMPDDVFDELYVNPAQAAAGAKAPTLGGR
jgi:hypothetical protein